MTSAALILPLIFFAVGTIAIYSIIYLNRKDKEKSLLWEKEKEKLQAEVDANPYIISHVIRGGKKGYVVYKRRVSGYRSSTPYITSSGISEYPASSKKKAMDWIKHFSKDDILVSKEETENV